MDLETWTTALAAVVSVLAIIGFSARSSRRLEVQITELARTVDQLRESGRADLTAAIGGLRTELTSDITDLRSELKSDTAELRGEMRDGLGRIDARLTVIEQRTYDLSTRLPPAPAAPRP